MHLELPIGLGYIPAPLLVRHVMHTKCVSHREGWLYTRKCFQPIGESAVGRIPAISIVVQCQHETPNESLVRTQLGTKLGTEPAMKLETHALRME
jgi:hypothetical protein